MARPAVNDEEWLFVVSLWCLAAGLACWLQAVALPGGLGLSPTMVRLGPGGYGPAWAWRAPEHTHKTHTPPHLNEVNLVCAVTKPALPLASGGE